MELILYPSISLYQMVALSTRVPPDAIGVLVARRWPSRGKKGKSPAELAHSLECRVSSEELAVFESNLARAMTAVKTGELPVERRDPDPRLTTVGVRDYQHWAAKAALPELRPRPPGLRVRPHLVGHVVQYPVRTRSVDLMALAMWQFADPLRQRPYPSEKVVARWILEHAEDDDDMSQTRAAELARAIRPRDAGRGRPKGPGLKRRRNAMSSQG
jgi:hypothetical protein